MLMIGSCKLSIVNVDQVFRVPSIVPIVHELNNTTTKTVLQL